MWKAPVFQHFGVIVGFIILIGRTLGLFSFEALIPISLALLAFVQLFLLSLILAKFKRIYLQLSVLMLFYLMFSKTYFQFMTDSLAALAIGFLILSFIKLSLANTHETRRVFVMLLAVTFIVIGLRTTLLPVILIPIFYLLMRKTSASKSEFTNLIKIFVIFVFSTGFVYLMVWPWVINGALQAFIGNQSAYFAFWTKIYEIDLVALTIDRYSSLLVPTLFTLGLILRKFYEDKKANVIDFEAIKVHSLGLIPGFLVFLLFIASKSKDPRFLEWPVFSIFLVLFYFLDFKTENSGIEQKSFSRKWYLALPIVTSIFMGISVSSANFGMSSTNHITKTLRNEPGVICPVTDSPTINYPKVLLSFERSGFQGLQSGRVRNLADNALNGKSLEASLNEFKECDFVIVEVGIQAGAQKSEYLSQYLKLLEGKSYFELTRFDSIKLYKKN
jgi:hypothetical protein